MNRFTVCSVAMLTLILIGALTAFAPFTTKADLSRTITVPDDYSTIQEAVNNANDGNIIYVKSGIYRENPIYTNKSISIIGYGSQSTFIEINCPAHEDQFYEYTLTTFDRAIEVHADNFVLSGFKITTNGGDVSFSGNRSQITNNIIAAPFSADGYYVDIVGNTFLSAHFKSGYGKNFAYQLTCTLMMSNFSRNTILYDTNMCAAYLGGRYVVMTNNSISGVCLGVSARPCFFSGNNVSNVFPFNFPSNYSVITKNTLNDVPYGFGAEGSGNIVFANQITNCGTRYGAPTEHFPLSLAQSNQSNLFYGNNFVDSSCPIHTIYSNKVDALDNGTIGNYWSNYRGTDSDGDGIGDISYQPVYSNGTDTHPLMAPFDTAEASDLKPDWAQSLNSILLAKIDDAYGWIPIVINGDLSSTQISNAKTSTNQSDATATFSFILTGQSSVEHFSNITIPLSAVPQFTLPTIYIDNQLASNQGYTQDNDNYYVWFTVPPYTHEISILFAKAAPDNSIMLTLIVAIIALLIVGALLIFRRHRNEPSEILRTNSLQFMEN